MSILYTERYLDSCQNYLLLEYVAFQAMKSYTQKPSECYRY